MSLRIAAAFALVLAVLAPPASAYPETHDRIYLLSADSALGYWSVDADDPEASRTAMDRTCSPAVLRGIPGHESCTLRFLPASALGAESVWTTGAPMRFRLALDVDTAVPYTVHLSLQGRSGLYESPAATEVAPGVWEGSIATGGLSPGAASIFSVVVRTAVPSPLTSVRLDTAGASYLSLPDGVPARGIPALAAADPGAGRPATTLSTAMRWFRFNDDLWEATSFSGDLLETRTFDVTVDEPAAFVMAWVELFDRPAVHDLLNGRPPDSRKLTDSPRTELIRDGQRLVRGANSGLYGLGMDTVVAMDLEPGPLSLRVTPTQVWPTTFQQGHPYRAHVLVVYGDRSLRWMRWLSMFADYPGYGPANAPLVAHCPGDPTEQVPVTDTVASYRVDMSYDTVALPTADWSLAFELPGGSALLCSEYGNNRSLRFTFDAPGVARVGPTVAQDSSHSEWRQTVFEFETSFIHVPPAT